MSKATNTFPKQTGFTLVEALVALVILSIGMLGVAALYVESLQAGRVAQSRTQAVNLAGDMADRIRANPTALAAYGGPGLNNGCSGAAAVNCTPAQLAAHDVFLWQTDAANMLPAGAGAVAFNGATLPSTYTITLSWSEVGSAVPIVYALTVQI